MESISKGGGSLIYYKNYINISVYECFNKAPDSLAISVETSIGNICLACVYRSPSLSRNLNDQLVSCMGNICDESNDFETVILGDLNLPDVSWETGAVKGLTDSNNKILIAQGKYMDFFNTKGMSWHFTNETTRRRLVKGSLQESLLDQVLFSNDALVADVELLPPLGKSDHLCLMVELGVSLEHAKVANDESGYKTSWSKVNSRDLLNLSKENVDWSYSGTDMNVQEMWDELHAKLNGLASMVPKFRTSGDGRPVKVPWSSSSLKRMMKNKEKAWHCFDITPTYENLNYALSRQRLYEEEECRLKMGYERKITSILNVNCKPFYAYLRNKRKLKTCVPFLDKGDGTRTQCASESAEVLADAFSSVFIAEPLGPLPRSEVDDEHRSILSDIYISSDDIKKELSKINIYKSFGPDQVHPKLLRSLAYDDDFVAAVTELFSKCSTSGVLPSVWKEASVVALFKSGKKTNPLNYRPVSLTCILCKVYEQIIRSEIVTFLEGKISKHQHGFVQGRSCLSNLLETFDSIFNILGEGAPVDLLYFDFSKAFDRVPHFRLLSKLESMGIQGNVLNVIRDFLTDRTLKVSVNGKYSETKLVLSGVPQGSVLGPLLFVLFINDLPESIKSDIKVFADDIKIIGNANNHYDIVNDLKELEYWESIWLLSFNVDKCKVLHIQHNENPLHDYYLDGLRMKKSVQEKDLGVLTSDSLLWNEQIKSSVSKANQMICWIVRNLTLREKSVMLPVYKALVRPHLEYCVQLWNPVAEQGNWSLISELEGVQRRFTRLIDEVGTLPYSERLDKLNLTTLAERRIRGDLIEAFKAVNGFSSLDNIFNISRSGLNLVSKSMGNGSTKAKSVRRKFSSLNVLIRFERNCLFVLSHSVA